MELPLHVVLDFYIGVVWLLIVPILLPVSCAHIVAWRHSIHQSSAAVPAIKKVSAIRFAHRVNQIRSIPVLAVSDIELMANWYPSYSSCHNFFTCSANFRPCRINQAPSDSWVVYPRDPVGTISWLSAHHTKQQRPLSWHGWAVSDWHVSFLDQ